jgi:hypothetical protein
MIKLPFSILLSGFLWINPAFAQDQDQQQPAAQDEAVTGMGTRLTAGPTFGGWTNPNSTGLSSSSCNPGEYAVGVQVDGADSSVKYCVGCVARLRVICQHLP